MPKFQAANEAILPPPYKEVEVFPNVYQVTPHHYLVGKKRPLKTHLFTDDATPYRAATNQYYCPCCDSTGFDYGRQFRHSSGVGYVHVCWPCIRAAIEQVDRLDTINVTGQYDSSHAMFFFMEAVSGKPSRQRLRVSAYALPNDQSWLARFKGWFRKGP